MIDIKIKKSRFSDSLIIITIIDSGYTIFLDDYKQHFYILLNKQ